MQGLVKMNHSRKTWRVHAVTVGAGCLFIVEKIETERVEFLNEYVIHPLRIEDGASPNLCVAVRSAWGTCVLVEIEK